MDIKQVESSYARWAPIYDWSFGAVTSMARKRTLSYVNGRSGTVLEVGVGTGLSLRHYTSGRSVTGIDFSEDMLAKAQAKVAQNGLAIHPDLHRMDAREMTFPDDHFDTVLAMHVISVVPEPEKVMSEIVRVCKPGGQVVMTNHFARDSGLLYLAERALAPFPGAVGWHSDFEIDTVLVAPGLNMLREETFPPLGIMTFMVFEKTVD